MQKRDLEKALILLATELSNKGFHAEAEQVDSILHKVAQEKSGSVVPNRRVTPPTEHRKFDIDVIYDVMVGKADFAQHDEPPPQTHKSCTARLVVRPVEGETVLEKVLVDKTLKARNLTAARQAMLPFVTQAKAKYSPASSDEQIKYQPV